MSQGSRLGFIPVLVFIGDTIDTVAMFEIALICGLFQVLLKAIIYKVKRFFPPWWRDCSS